MRMATARKIIKTGHKKAQLGVRARGTSKSDGEQNLVGET